MSPSSESGSFSGFFLSVTGCLKMEAVWRMGGMREGSGFGGGGGGGGGWWMMGAGTGMALAVVW